MWSVVLPVTLFFILRTCGGTASGDLAKLHNEFFAWRMSDRPVTATHRGIHSYDDQLESYNMTMFDVRKEKADDLYMRLKNIPQTELSKSDLVSYKILDDMLSTYIDGYQWRYYLNLNPISLMDGIQRNPSSFVNGMPFNTRGDFENYIARLHKLPNMYAEFETLMREGIRRQRTQHNYSMMYVEDQIMAMMVVPEENILYSPFNETLENSAVDDRYRSQLRNDGLSAVSEVTEAVRAFWNFIRDEYMPNTRPDIGISSLDEGREYYEACIKWYLSVNMTAQQIHDIGLQEVGRIVGRMQEIMKKQGFEGTVREYFSSVMTDERFFFNTSEEMLDEFRHQIYDVIDPTLGKYFMNLPGLPIEVKAMPNDGPPGSYSTGSADGSRPGIFWANVMRPESSPNLTMMALTIHEASPGHHLQLSYSITADTPDFRQKLESSSNNKVPFAFPRYTAFVEGWGLYAEFLGEEMGIYRSDHELMGRFSSEIFRACRLVVDTGIHAFNWTRAEAIDYLLTYTAVSNETITIEIDRYITWPGQALAYKIGEMKIKELRDKAEKQLGARFDIREFHSIVLESGTLPLAVLEDIVNDWLDSYSMTTPTPGLTPPTCDSVALSVRWSWLLSLVAASCLFGPLQY